MPLAITRTDDMPDELVAELKKANIAKVVVLGGESAVSKAVLEELKAKGIEVVERVSGNDRAETSVELAEYAEENFTNLDTSAVNVASGYIKGDGADALGGAALTGKQQRALLITRSNNDAGDSIIGYLGDNAERIEEGTIFGGASALADSVEYAMEKAVLGSGAQNAKTGELYNDVAAAVADAEEGDTITVFGKDNSGFTVNKAGVTIKGEPGAAVTGVVQVQGVDEVTVTGLTIAPGTVANQGAGIYLDNAEDVTITDNTVEGGQGVRAGVINTTGGEAEVATIEDNTFRNLTQGVFANPSAEFEIVDNVFQDNVAASANDTASVIRDNRFLNNDEGIGLGAKGSVVEGNSFAENNDVHVKDYPADQFEYDLAAMIDANEFDTEVVVDKDAVGGPEIVNKQDEQPTATPAAPQG
jgi:hypothetical protein